MGRDPGLAIARQAKDCVSIDAPAWGATGAAAGAEGTISVSIDAPAWGATSVTGVVTIMLEAVSIHAPAWGATAGEISLARAL